MVPSFVVNKLKVLVDYDMIWDWTSLFSYLVIKYYQLKNLKKFDHRQEF